MSWKGGEKRLRGHASAVSAKSGRGDSQLYLAFMHFLVFSTVQTDGGLVRLEEGIS